MLSARTAIARAPACTRVAAAPRFSARPISIRMGSQASSGATASDEVFAPEAKIQFTLDASANGCTGMFWRTRPDMNASESAPDWPRNGAKLQGWKSLKHPGWVKVDHPKDYWLPIEQHGKPVVHF